MEQGSCGGDACIIHADLSRGIIMSEIVWGIGSLDVDLI